MKVKKSRFHGSFPLLRGLRRELLFKLREIIPKRVRLPFRYKHIINYNFFISVNCF